MARPVMYPWKKWFRRRNLLLKKGKDYTCQSHGLAQQIRNYASKHNREVTISVEDKSVAVYIYKK